VRDEVFAIAVVVEVSVFEMFRNFQNEVSVSDVGALDVEVEASRNFGRVWADHHDVAIVWRLTTSCV